MHKKHKTKENFPRSSALYYMLSVLCYLYPKEVPASLVLRRGRIDKANFSQPARHHILRCCVRPFAVVLVDSFWQQETKGTSVSLLLRRERIDKDNFSQPARHHILRCCVRPFAVVLVDSFWQQGTKGTSVSLVLLLPKGVHHTIPGRSVRLGVL